MTPTEVLVADDHPAFREGLVSGLSARPDLVVVAAVGNGAEALAMIRERPPGVAVIDLGLPGLDGLGVIQAIVREGLPTRVLVVSAREDSATVYRVVAAGARGFVPKVVETSAICDAVAAVAKGETVLRPEIQSGLAEQIRMRREAREEVVLTPRETQIVRLAAEGLANAEIGRELHLSTGTVKSHLQSIFAKLEVSDRAAAVAKSIRRGLVD